MRLFIATGIFHPESGGPATYLRGLLPEVARAGHEVRLLTFGDPTPADADYGYAVQRIPRRSLPLRPLAYAEYARAARPQLAWADLTYLHSLGLPLWGESRGPRVVKIVGDIAWERAVRLGWVPPTEDVDEFQVRTYGPLVEAFKASRAREARRMDAVIVPSEYLKRVVTGWDVHPDKVRVIYNARHFERPPALSQTQARAELDLSDGPLLLTTARLTAWKGVGPLIEATAQLPGARLLVAGDGPLLADLKRIAVECGVSDRVTFFGNVPRDRVALLMRAADYTVLYSGYEGLAHTLLESLEAGTPVIASDKGGNPEVVIPGTNGFLVPYNNVSALAQTLHTAFAPGVRDSLAAGVRVGLERFAWETMVRATIACLESLVGR